jgi:hypothetical protein
MGLFTYFYYSSMIKEDDDGLMRSIENNKTLKFAPHSLLQIILFHLDPTQQVALFDLLKKSLTERGLLPGSS